MMSVQQQRKHHHWKVLIESFHLSGHTFKSCHMRRHVGPRDKITYMSHEATCRCDKSPQHVPNAFSQGLQSQGRPVIGLFTELSQRHVASACHMRGWNVRVTFCCRDVSHEFKLICIKTYMSHKVTCHKVVATGRLGLQDL